MARTWPDDLRSAVRALARAPRFAAAVVVTLAVAIAASTVIFSFVEELVLEPLPLAHPERVVLAYSENAGLDVWRGATSLPDYLDWRARATRFEELAAGHLQRSSLETASGPLSVLAQRATANLFAAWGLRPALGRTFAPGEDRAGAPPVVVLGDGFWRRQLGGDRQVLGRVLRLDGRPHTVVGVLGPEIEIGSMAWIDVWTPLLLDDTGWPRGRRTLQVTGLVAAGTSVAAADAELRESSRQLAAAHPETNAGWQARALPFAEAMTIPETWLVLGLASLAVALVLAVACANVAGLMLARGLDRRREVAVRLALGAARGRIVRPLLAQAALLGLAGGAAGLLLAALGLDLVRAVAFHPFFDQVTIDGRVLGFVLALALAAPLLFGVGPALAASRLAVRDVLQGAATGAVAGAGSQRTRAVLVVTQLALALALLVACSLTVHAAIALRRVDAGFDTARTLVLRADLPETRYPDSAAVARFQERLLAALAELPGVRHAAASDRLPLLDGERLAPLAIRGRQERSDGDLFAAAAAVSQGYFEVFAIELLAGRGFPPSGGGEAGAVALLSESAARRSWGSPAAALGAGVRLDRGPWREVIGVVRDVRRSLRESAPRPSLYLPLAQHPERRLAFVLRAEGPPEALAAAAREMVRRIDAELAVEHPRSFDQALFDSLEQDRLVAGFFTAFALVALLLAATGLYGLMAYSVGRRRGEIGVRMALGARPRDVLALVLGEGARLAALGIALGIAAAWPLARAMRGAVHGVEPSGPALWGGVAALFAATALLASYLPTRRALRVDPAEALRAPGE
ncbi:MAG TPA: ADOP family duplicated permease [Thermoanaerobaculia bacterium]|nr:ADOP family duplicated permease [Thermoanaerobaculia bacterium]